MPDRSPRPTPRLDPDALGQWLAERCTCAPGARRNEGALYGDWTAWARTHGAYVGRVGLFNHPRRPGFRAPRNSQATIVRGARLKATPPSSPLPVDPQQHMLFA